MINKVFCIHILEEKVGTTVNENVNCQKLFFDELSLIEGKVTNELLNIDMYLIKLNF